MSEYPRRVVRLDATRERYGERADVLVDAMLRRDPLADDAIAQLADLGPPGRGLKLLERALRDEEGAHEELPDGLAALVEDVNRVPDWVDWERVDRGGRLLIRTGIVGGLVLALRSLVIGYKSPAGNKPLTLSGRLEAMAPRRLNETTRFVQAVSFPGGMRLGGDGFVITVKVRLMHAQVRRLLARDARWRGDLWGIPINQHDMVSTIQLFSTEMLNGLEQVGVNLGGEEVADVMHLWRWVGHVIGVEDALMPETWAGGREVMEIVDALQAPPDDDARALVRALLHSPLIRATSEPERVNIQRQMGLVCGFFRHLHGDKVSEQLGVPDSPWRHVLAGAKPLVRGMEGARTRLALLDRLVGKWGVMYWSNLVETSLGDKPATFTPPDRLDSKKEVNVS